MKDEHGVPEPVSREELRKLKDEWVPLVAMIDRLERRSYSNRADVLAAPAKYGDIVDLLGLDHATREQQNLIDLATVLFGKGVN